MANGKYIVIEGIAGAGKSTVLERVARELQAAQVPVQIVSDVTSPQNFTAQAIQRIVDDPRYPVTNRAEVLLYNATRAQTLDEIQKALAAGVVCLADHSYLTTLVNEYYGRGDITEYAVASQIVQFAAGHLPPDLTIVLDAPVNIVKARLSADQQATFDEAYQERIRAGYLWEAQQRALPIVYATDSVDTVIAAVWEHVRKTVSRPTDSAKAQSVAEVLAASPPAIAKTPAAETELKDTTSPQTTQTRASAAVGNRHQETQSITIENASQLLAQRLEQSPLTAAYTHEPLPYTDFDQKDAQGHYRYYIPETLRGKARSQYIRTMNQLFDAYAKLITDLTAHIRSTSTTSAKQRSSAWRSATKTEAYNAARWLLPIAATASVSVPVFGRKLEELALELADDELSEARAASQRILEQAHLAAHDQKQASRSSRSNGARSVRELAQELLAPSHTAESDPVMLVSRTPHNELDIVASLLYRHSDLPLHFLQQQTSVLPYQRKVDVITAYLAEHTGPQRLPGHAIEDVRYSFDIVSDYATFRDLQRHATFETLHWQMLTPRLGFDVPNLVENAGQLEAFEQCFELSLQLYSTLQANDFPLEAQYATLLGHKMRWCATYNARTALRLYKLVGSRGTPSSRALLQQMHEKIAEVHPLLATSIRFAPYGKDVVGIYPGSGARTESKLDSVVPSE